MSQVHLKDTTKKYGIRCNRWHRPWCMIVEDISKITCKGCKGEKRAPNRYPPKPRALKAGDILIASWGYDQTNIDFYQVIRLVGNMSVEVQKIRSKIHDTPHCTYNNVVAVKDAFIAPRPNDSYDARTIGPMIRRVSGTGVSIDDCRYASLWDGVPRYETALGFGH